MDQTEENKWKMPWYDWLVFVVPTLLIVGLGVESALGPKDVEYHDFRAVAHWFDPVFFQYNLIMALLAVLVVPSLALTYIQTMTNRKERQLQREVPVARRGEIRRRMGRRASFSTYRGSVWLTTIIVLLGICILLLFKPVSSADGGVDFSLGANMLTMGPFAELFEKNPEAYYSHLVRNLTAFQYGFLGAYIYFIGSVARAYFTLDLTSHTFVDGAIRMIVASILSLVLSFVFHFTFPEDSKPAATRVAVLAHDAAEPPSATEASSATEAPSANKDSGDSSETGTTIPASLSLLPVLSFFFGFYPKRAALAIERVALKVMRNIPGDNYRALPLSMLAGMSYAHELRLEREGYDNIENLCNADAVDLAVRTCFTYNQLKQWIDQAWLAAHLREDYPDFVRHTGITSSDELWHFLSTCESAQINGVDELVAGLSIDPASIPSWKVKLTALKILLNIYTAPPGDSISDTKEHGPD